MKFQPTPNKQMGRELLLLKKEFGGRLGELQFGGGKLEGVLQLKDNLFVTTNRVDKSWDAAAEMVGADVHEIKTAADVEHFKLRLKEFLNGAQL